MWTEQFNGWCLTQTVLVAEVSFVLYSRLVGDGLVIGHKLSN